MTLAPNRVVRAGALDIAELRKAISLWREALCEFRGQGNNARNRFNPGTPNTTIGAPDVGKITSGGAGRSLLLSLRLHY